MAANPEQQVLAEISARTVTETESTTDNKRHGEPARQPNHAGLHAEELLGRQLLVDAENLVRYAAIAGVDIDDSVRLKVIGARSAMREGSAPQESADLLTAVTALSKALKPVSAESLRKCLAPEAATTMGWYKWCAFALVILIIPYSILAYVASATCEAITKDIEVANGLAVTLSADSQGLPQPSPNDQGNASKSYSEQRIKTLQQFTSTFRDIDARVLAMKRSKVFRHFGAAKMIDPFNRPEGVDFTPQLQLLPADLSSKTYAVVVAEKISVYQEVRQFAKGAQEAVSIRFGAITSGLLPMMYALLGALAYLISVRPERAFFTEFTGVFCNRQARMKRDKRL